MFLIMAIQSRQLRILCKALYIDLLKTRYNQNLKIEQLLISSLFIVWNSCEFNKHLEFSLVDGDVKFGNSMYSYRFL